MNKIKSFIMTSLPGGIIVALPVAVLAAGFGWVFKFCSGAYSTQLIEKYKSQI